MSTLEDSSKVTRPDSILLFIWIINNAYLIYSKIRLFIGSILIPHCNTVHTYIHAKPKTTPISLGIHENLANLPGGTSATDILAY